MKTNSDLNLFSPSVHEAFDLELENDERGLFEEAEMMGKMGENCEKIYAECKTSPLHDVSNFISE